MSILFECQHCQRRLKVNQTRAGQTVRCVVCGQQTSVPTLAASLEATKTFSPASGSDTAPFPSFEVTKPKRPTQQQSQRLTRRQRQNRTLYITLGSLGGLFAIFVVAVAMFAGNTQSESDAEGNHASAKSPGEAVAAVDGRTGGISGPSDPKAGTALERPSEAGSYIAEPKPQPSASPPTERNDIPLRPQDSATFEDGHRISWNGGPVQPVGIVNAANLIYTGEIVARNSVGRVPVITVMSEPFSILRFSPDDQQIVVQADLKTVQILKRSQSTSTLSWDSIASLDHQNEIFDATFSPDGQLLVTGSGPLSATKAADSPPGQLKFWNAATGELIGAPLEFPHRVRRVVFSPDGQLLAVSSSSFDFNASKKTLYGFAPADAVYLIDVNTRKRRFAPLKNVGEVHVLRFSPDGKRLVTAGLLDSSVRIWSVSDGKALGEPIPHAAGISEVLFDRSGRKLITGCHDGKVYIRDANTGRVLADCQDTIPEVDTGQGNGHLRTLLAITPDGQRIASARFKGGKVRLWAAPSGKPVAAPIEHPRIVTVVEIAPQGKLLLSADYSGIAQFWSVATGKPIGPPMQHDAAVSAATFSHDGRLLLTASPVEVRIWSVPRAF